MMPYTAYQPSQKPPERISLKDRGFIEKIDYSGNTSPVTINQIYIIENQNYINVNVFCYENSTVFPIRISSKLVYLNGNNAAEGENNIKYANSYPMN